MLNNLKINNFIIIDNLNINFNNGLNIFTGDTGSGKSIIIEALNIIKGAKFDKNHIKENTDYACIEATFNISNNEIIKDLLKDINIEYKDTITIYRYIDNKSNTKVLLNKEPIKLNLLNKLLENTIDIVNQKDTDKVLNKKNHINILDSYINKPKLLNEISNLYNIYINYQKEYSNIIKQVNDNNYIEYLQSQLEEIECLNLKENEDIILKEKEKEYKELEKKHKAYKEALLYFNKDNGINENIYAINELLKDKLEFNKSINECNLLIEQINDQLEDYISNNNIDYNTYNDIQDRLFKINTIIKKYGSTNNALNKSIELKNNINNLLNKDIILSELTIKIKDAHTNYLHKALELHNYRVSKALTLEKYINQELSALCMNDAIFKINVSEGIETDKGYDNIIFTIATNGSTKYNSIDKVLSGGEFSRLMLIIKDFLIKAYNIKCVVFDEIDTGISGSIAHKAGQKLLKMSTNKQLFVITHLAIVASFAQNHYKISKYNNSTSIKLLSEKEVINELTLMNFSEINDENIKATKKLVKNSKNTH